MPQYAFGYSYVFQYGGIHTMITGRVAAQNYIRRNILLYAASALHERVASDTDVLLYDGTVALYGAVVQLAFACDDSTYSDDTIVADNHVVADMDLVHQEVAVADGRCLVFVSASGNHYVFADAVVVADDDMRLVAFYEMEVLGSGSDDRILIDDIVVAHLCAFEDAGMGHDDAVVADDRVFVYVGEWFDFYVRT